MSTTLRPPINESDHIAGPADAPITLVEFGDYECPFCGRAEGVVRALRQHLGDRMRLVFRNFPIVSAHPHAVLAAEAAEAAGAQGQFWAMHDLLFDNQDALEAR
jgi:NhaA family Na+:H+ antiporter